MKHYRISDWQMERIREALLGRGNVEQAKMILRAVEHDEVESPPPIVINSPITVCDVDPTLTMSDMKIDQEERARHEPYNKKLY